MKIILKLNTKQLQTLKAFTSPQDENFRFLDRMWDLSDDSMIDLVDAICKSFDYFKSIETSGSVDVKVKTTVELSKDNFETLQVLTAGFLDEHAKVLAPVFGVEQSNADDLMWAINQQIQ